MTTILRTGIVRGGQIVLADPMDLPDGSEVTILGVPPHTQADVEFMTEDEQSDDPEAIRRWSEELHSLPPVPDELKRECEPTEWDEQMSQFNREAIRKQLQEGTP